MCHPLPLYCPSPPPPSLAVLRPLPQVRLHCIHQAGSTSAVERDSPTKLPLNHPDSPTRRTAGRRQMSLAVVLERARARLMEARGGSVAVREGVVAEAPFLRQQPEDVECDEGATVQFEVAAGVSAVRDGQPVPLWGGQVFP